MLNIFIIFTIIFITFTIHCCLVIGAQADQHISYIPLKECIEKQNKKVEETNRYDR